MQRPEGWFRWAMGVACVLTACSGGPPRPVEIALNEEVCRQCRMAVSQQEFAAEIVTGDGGVYYFDDIGCLARWAQENEPPERAGWFVTDYGTHGWLDAQAAFYVRSSRLPTPMSYGLAAFQTRDRAQAAANRLDGDVVEWSEILEEGA